MVWFAGQLAGMLAVAFLLGLVAGYLWWIAGWRRSIDGDSHLDGLRAEAHVHEELARAAEATRRAEQRAADLEARLHGIDGATSEQASALAKAEAALARREEEISSLNAALQRQLDEAAEQARTIVQLREALQEVRATAAEQEEELLRMRPHLEGANTRIADLAQQEQSRMDRIRELHDALEITESLNEALARDNEVKNHAITAMQVRLGELDSLQEDVIALRRQLEQQQDELAQRDALQRLLHEQDKALTGGVETPRPAGSGGLGAPAAGVQAPVGGRDRALEEARAEVERLRAQLAQSHPSARGRDRRPEDDGDDERTAPVVTLADRFPGERDDE